MAFEAEQFLQDVLGARSIRRRGDELEHPCLLPWGPHEHDDKQPAASLNMEKLLYNCFKCGTGGTLLWATETILQVTSAEARKLIQGTFNADEISPESFLSMIEQAWQVKGEAAMPHYDLKIVDAWSCPTAYMDTRGITREVQREMRTGVNVRNMDRIGSEMLVQPRIVIPHVFQNVLRGWTMRLIDNRQRGNKYKHTEQFPKRATLYNYDGAKQHDEVVVVESPMSALKLKSYGIDNVVATFGAEVNAGQVALIAKWDSVILFPDGDKAGYRALRRTDDRDRTYGLVEDLIRHPAVKIVDHGFTEKDPADYTEDEVRALLSDSVDAATWGYSFVMEPKKQTLRAVSGQEDWN